MPKNKYKVLHVLTGILIIVIIGAAAFFFIQLKNENAQLKNDIARIMCKGKWSNDSCTDASIAVLSPVEGQDICVSDTQQIISWQIPEDMEKINIWLERSDTIYPLETNLILQPPKQERKENYTWNVIKTAEKFFTKEPSPDDYYKIIIDGIYKGMNINAKTGYFRIIDCGSSTGKKI